MWLINRKLKKDFCNHPVISNIKKTNFHTRNFNIFFQFDEKDEEKMCMGSRNTFTIIGQSTLKIFSAPYIIIELQGDIIKSSYVGLIDRVM